MSDSGPEYFATARVYASLILILLLTACGEKTPLGPPHCPEVGAGVSVPQSPAPAPASAEASPAHLRAWVEVLAAPEMRGRHATSDEARAVAAMVAGRMAALGLAAPFAGDSYCQSFPLPDATGHNVVGHLPAGAAGAGEAVLVGAHYDGQGVHPAGFVYPSADDNASGVAALVEVARLAVRRSWPFDLVFVAFGSEETDQRGARAWVREPSLPLARLRLMVNFDMVGRPWPGSPPEAIGYRVTGNATAPEAVTGRLAAAGAAAGIAVRRLTERFTEDDMISDATVFSPHVPTLYLSTGFHADHHQASDTAERVDVDQIARAVRLTLSLLERLAAD